MTRPRQSAINASLRSSSCPLVPTAYAPTLPRDTGRYDSGERLPDLERLFDRTVNQIRHAHDTRQHGSKDFEKRWRQVCRDLSKRGNASAYARWKHSEAIAKPINKISTAWAKLKPFDDSSSPDLFVFTGYEEFQAQKDKHTSLWVDAPLEIAIAYWIEARNAYNQGHELRALHALLECHFYFGIASSPKTESESKRAVGRKSGQKERDALAGVVLNVMQNFTVAKSIYNEELLLESITQAIEGDPAYAAVLHAYDARPSERTKDSIGIRFPTTLKTWVTGKKPLYPHLAPQFQKLARQITKKPATRNVVRRKANG